MGDCISGHLSRIQFLTSKISHSCQEIRDIKSVRKPKSYSLPENYTITCMDEGQKGQRSIQEPNSNSSAMEDNNDGDGLDGTCSSHSKQCHCEPNNLDIPSHHAPSPPCQEIGLVAFMFFFELLFFYVSFAISFYVSFTNLFSIILSPYLLITRDTQDEGEARFQFY